MNKATRDILELRAQMFEDIQTGNIRRHETRKPKEVVPR